MLCWMQPTQHAQQHCLAWLNLCMIFLAEGPRMPGWGVTNTAGSRELFKGLPMSLTGPKRACAEQTLQLSRRQVSWAELPSERERREFAVQTQPRRLLAGKREQWFSGKTDSSLSKLNAQIPEHNPKIPQHTKNRENGIRSQETRKDKWFSKYLAWTKCRNYILKGYPNCPQ